MIWFQESLFPNVRQTFLVTRELFRERTEHQDLAIFETPTYGRVLALDGIVQVTERDEFIYHEMMTHVPIFAHGAARQVLIIGGGDGGILEEALKHKVDRVTMVEIDRRVVDLCLTYMPSICGKAFDDPRTNLVIADGARFVAETKDKFDVVIIDSTDPMGPGEVLFTETFYADLKRLLTPDGIIVNQNGVPYMQGDEVTTMFRRRRQMFADSGYYVAAVPSYYGGFMTLGWNSPGKRGRETPVEKLRERYRAAAFKTRYYTPDLHVGAFQLPGYVQELLT